MVKWPGPLQVSFGGLAGDIASHGYGLLRVPPKGVLSTLCVPFEHETSVDIPMATVPESGGSV